MLGKEYPTDTAPTETYIDSPACQNHITFYHHVVVEIQGNGITQNLHSFRTIDHFLNYSGLPLIWKLLKLGPPLDL